MVRRPASELATAELAGLPLHLLDAPDVVRHLKQESTARRGTCFRFVNVHTIASLSSTPGYRDTWLPEGINLIDGAPVAALASVEQTLSLRRPTRVKRTTGPDVLTAALLDIDAQALRHAFVGDTQSTLKSLKAKLYPTHTTALFYSPPFSSEPETLAEDICQIASISDIDILWLGLGSPKQDFVASILAKQLNIPIVAVGAAFGFAAGTRRRAPNWIRRLGLEWMFRLCTEPRRLWRRYTIGSIHFLASLIRGHKRRGLIKGSKG